MAVVSTKIHAHGLTRTTTGITGHYCDGCRAALTESYRCAPCNFDLCGACFGKHKSTQPTRVHAHPVTYTTVGLDNHFCDVCSATTTRESWRCASCNFDICTTCFETIKTPKPVVATPAPTEVKTALTVRQHAHPLTRTSGLSGHFCDSCKVGVTESFRCAPCNWDLCSACYTKSSQQVSRLHAHPLTHTTTGLEGHFCDGCRAVAERESWRCSECNFDLCATCTTRTSTPKTTPATTTPAATAATETKTPAPAVELKVHAHSLTRTTTGLSGHHCDVCRASPLTVSFRCAPCNYDVCSACNERVHKQVFSLHPHALTYTTDSKSLESHYCDGCRTSLTGISWRCSGCNFDLCPTCAERCRAPKPAPTPRPADAKVEPVLTKAHQHALTRTTTGLSGHHCDGCRATALTVSHRCDTCNFDLCNVCFNRNRLAHTSRMHAHPLAFARGLTSHWCDDCRKPVTAAWRCDDCNFDLCVGCFARAKLPKKAVEVKAAVETKAPTPAAAEKFAVKGHVHRVEQVTSGLTGHFCDSCRASPLTSAYRCAPCNYDLCGACFETARVTKTSRVHTHPLRWTSGLTSHYCDLCRKTTAEAYRCESCNFDSCAACFTTASAASSSASATTPAFWSCAACTYVNAQSASTCYICASAKP